MAQTGVFRDTLEAGEGARKQNMEAKCARHAALQALMRALFTGVLSLAEWVSIPSPYAVLCILSIARPNAFPVAEMIGALCALGFRMIWGAVPDLWQYAGCALAACLHAAWPRRTRGALAVKLSAALLIRVLACGMAGDMSAVFLSMASIVCGLVCVPLAAKFADAEIQPEGGVPNELTDSEDPSARDATLRAALACALAVAGGARMALFIFNIGVIIAGLVTLGAARARGAAAGVCVGMGCGVALSLSGQGRLLPVCLGFAGLAAGLMPGRSVLSALAYAAGCALLALAGNEAATLQALWGLMLGGALCFAIPARVLARAEDWLPETTYFGGDEAIYLREQNARWSRAMQRIAQSLPSGEEKGDIEEAEALAAHLCADCANTGKCFGEMLPATREKLAAAARGLYCEGSAVLPEGCPREEQLAACARRASAEIEARRARTKAVQSDRKLIAEQLECAARAVMRLSRPLPRPDVADARLVPEITRALRRAGAPAAVRYARRVDGHLRVALEAQPLPIARWQPGLIVRALCQALGELEIVENENGYLLLEETPPLRLMTGSASVSAGMRLLQSPCGDAVLAHRFLGGECLLAISDGMGHGERAGAESKKALELLALCMEAGYSRKQAVEAVNGMLMRTASDEMYATVDLCLVNLYTGAATFSKLGACPSYLVRDGMAHALGGGALPLGIVEAVRPLERRANLLPGDMLIMMTDGASDALEKEANTELFMAACASQTRDAQPLADTLLQAALSHASPPRDDMTVLCVSVTRACPTATLGGSQRKPA